MKELLPITFFEIYYDIFCVTLVYVYRLLEDNKVKTLRLKDEVEKLTKTVTDIKDEIKKERERSAKMLLKLQEITKDKEDLLIRYILGILLFIPQKRLTERIENLFFATRTHTQTHASLKYFIQSWTQRKLYIFFYQFNNKPFHCLIVRNCQSCIFAPV